MRIPSLRLPSLEPRFRENLFEYLRQFVRMSEDNYRTIENAVNESETNQATRAQVWFYG